MKKITPKIGLIAGLIALSSAGIALAATPSVEFALQLTPTQKGVIFETPSKEEVKQCTISSPKIDGKIGWIVKNRSGLLLRRFLDTNGDNKVDQWCYYKDGVEVYRDVDSDFNEKADQFRWLNTGGVRFGIDDNQDGKFDRWKMISPEEVASEATAAWATNDAKRFERLLLTQKELEKLGLGKETKAKLAKRLASAKENFSKTAAAQKKLNKSSRSVQFGSTQPGLIPKGTNDSTEELQVYENATSIIETDGKHDEMLIGTLVRVGDVWRLIDTPRLSVDSELMAGGFFFQPTGTGARPGLVNQKSSDAGQAYLVELEKVDQQLQKATSTKAQAKLNERRAELLEKVAKAASTRENREIWYRQTADMINAAVQTGTYPGGIDHLARLFKELSKSKADLNLAAYVRFLQLSAEYGESLRAEKPDYQKLQDAWIENLTDFAKQYPNSPDTAEAMLQLAMSQEFASEEKEAAKWYGQIVKSFPNSNAAKKAQGAKRRIESVGQRLSLKGQSVRGKKIDLSRYQGRPVVIQYWASWSTPAKTDMATLKELISKYGSKLGVIGVNLDAQKNEMQSFLQENRIAWPQIFEEGGLDSRLANELGIVTVPTMILVDKSGRVVDRNIEVSELDTKLKKLF
jgi:thiol-disulfide isomerase/thioredoxin/outer membrane protein assembly factor BamD (BamD/ComL family)